MYIPSGYSFTVGGITEAIPNYRLCGPSDALALARAYSIVYGVTCAVIPGAPGKINYPPNPTEDCLAISVPGFADGSNREPLNVGEMLSKENKPGGTWQKDASGQPIYVEPPDIPLPQPVPGSAPGVAFPGFGDQTPVTASLADVEAKLDRIIQAVGA